MNSIDIILQRMFGIMDSIKAQNPKLYEHLRQVMKYQGIYYPSGAILFHIGDRVDRAFFISEGFITRSSKNKQGTQQVLSIFEADEIKAGPDFMQQTPSEFLIEAISGTFLAYITHEQLKVVYSLFPEAHELASLIISQHNRKEARLRKLLLIKGIDLVESFYKRYPKLIEPGSVLTDKKIASFLKISISLLREHRSELFATRKLIKPTNKNGK
ncbi:Crp/Fnr family transcriptional regulator [Pedobacter foliorum]|uniref:Crp/Fnr family transcriptional regulator n=1 Tax=Pedobacter foliorum TaxID=2739058 RepID=UPI001563A4BD|nr:cyclic nucleotide-binding domain-containing protein [Pedobacter foliorum]NRF37591.1 Crp/Fnr family transcriptional regulator [Pedobacter foliorum]